MPNASYHFPAGFLWGCATAAQQVEGGNTNNNWSQWEQQPGHMYKDQKTGLACDWWGGRWREDFDRAADTGQNAHRMSIEWSRIQPTPDRWDESALDYYREMVRGLNQRNMTPMVTLHHFSDPIWLVEMGGWENPAVVDRFVAFVRKAVEALKEYVTLWVPINEPIVYTYGGWLNGGFPPGKNDMGLAFSVLLHLLQAHNAAYRVIHELQPQARVGTAHHYRGFYPASASPLDRAMANMFHGNWNDSFMGALHNGRFRFVFKSASVPDAVGKQDFVGINYYTADRVTFDLLRGRDMFSRREYDKKLELSETGFIASYPRGMFDCIRWATKYQKPIIITENGVEDSADRMRPNYLVTHLHQMWRAVNFNFPVKGYFHWSLVDNFEWERGWSQRFGLWGLDVPTQTRIRRPSVDLYAAICKENGISGDMVEKWAPGVLNQLFPE